MASQEIAAQRQTSICIMQIWFKTHHKTQKNQNIWKKHWTQNEKLFENEIEWNIDGFTRNILINARRHLHIWIKQEGSDAMNSWLSWECVREREQHQKEHTQNTFAQSQTSDILQAEYTPKFLVHHQSTILSKRFTLWRTQTWGSRISSESPQ